MISKEMHGIAAHKITPQCGWCTLYDGDVVIADFVQDDEVDDEIIKYALSRDERIYLAAEECAPKS